MRKRIQQSKKADGLLSVRISIWLILFGSVLICALTIRVSQNRRDQLAASENPSNEEPSRHNTGALRPNHIAHAPSTDDSGVTFDFNEYQLTVIDEMMQDRRTWMDGPAF